MKPTRKLHDLGQSIWLDNITRELLSSGTLERYIRELSVTGLTSNPTIFDQAFLHTDAYDAEIEDALACGASAEDAFFRVAIADLRSAADHFRPTWDETRGLDGWVSLEVSPLLAYDPVRTLAQAKRLHATADRCNLFIKIPGTPEGLSAIEEAILAGVPVNTTLLFSREQYLAAAEAYMRGLERRVEAKLRPNVASVASVFVSRWDTATGSLGLGVAMAKRTYAVYRDLLDSPRWRRLAELGARPQRLLWASTGPRIRTRLTRSM
jgi:transaldolase